jgi:ribosomal protein S18 acetylase RimI-like enzyme
MLVTVENENVIGFITYYIHKRRKLGIIGTNAVEPCCQNKGIGKKQYNEVLKIFKKRGNGLC